MSYIVGGPTQHINLIVVIVYLTSLPTFRRQPKRRNNRLLNLNLQRLLILIPRLLLPLQFLLLPLHGFLLKLWKYYILQVLTILWGFVADFKLCILHFQAGEDRFV